MGNKHSKPRPQLPEIDAGTNMPRPQLPEIKFRVLIIGRANAGKTSLLQRVCDTTDSPVIHRLRYYRTMKVQLDITMDRGEHSIHDEITFSNHDGYVFHDSRGFESGSVKELRIVQKFIRERSSKRELRNRLHAIWYCVPMDNQRPELDLRFFQDICPDKSVPVIAVFTKHDQFMMNVKFYVEDYGNPGDNVADVAKRQFEEHYLRHLGEGARFVRLERMHKPETRCHVLIEETVEALNGDVVALMLLGVQKSNLELSVSLAVKRVHRIKVEKQKTRDVIKTCLIAFPQIWTSRDIFSDDRDFSDAAGAGVSGIGAGGAGGGFGGGAGIIRDRYRDDDDLDLRLDKLDIGDRELKDITSHVMSLSIIARHTPTGNSNYYLRLAIVLILKRATALCHSGVSAKLALTQAESEFQREHTATKIEEHFTASYQDYTIQQFIGFIMDTNIAT